MNYRKANQADIATLAELNRQLIEDESHRNQMSLAELKQRMHRWLFEEYEAILFEVDGVVVAYALYCLTSEYIYLRQFFVSRNHRGKNIGRRAVTILQTKVWPANVPIRVEVLVGNEAARSFWKSVGFSEYAVTLEMSSNLYEENSDEY